MTCPSCRHAGPSGAAWCPRCYLPYNRPSTAGTTVLAGRHRTVLAAPAPAAPKTEANWGVRLLCVGLAVLVGWGLFVGMKRGLSCEETALHPNSKPLQVAVQKQLSAVQTLATGDQGWTPADGAKVVAADAALAPKVAALHLSAADRQAITSYLVAVHTFDTALSAYMNADDDATHAVYGSSAVALQKAADNLSTGLAATPKRCRSF